MACYNHERYLPQAIDSVLCQTFPDLELIIIDDASTDRSPRIIEQYQAKDRRIKAYFHQKNQGIAHTANQCLSAAEGEFVSFIGSDDLWVPSKLDKQLNVLRSNQDRIVWSEGEVIDAKGAPMGVRFTEMNAGAKKPKTGRIFSQLLTDNYIFGQSVIFKREFCRNLSFNPRLKYLCDYQFMADLAFEHDFLFIAEPLAKYRVHGKNTIHRDDAGWLRDRILARNYFLQRYGGSISNRLRGILNLRIGEAYSGLGQEAEAKPYYMRALIADFKSKEVFLYLAYMLTFANSFTRNFLVRFYLKLDSLISRVLAKPL
jgi:glycosyltransferase involved in cell wall biosynthesis